MRRLLILADDLTGAADCANACMHSGLRAVVSFGERVHAHDDDVLSIDCDTRHRPTEQAAARVVRIMRDNTAGGPLQLIFKKVDSTLRGNVAAEISAVLEEQRRVSATGTRAVAVLAPAFPSGGRTTIDGHQLVRGVPLHETEMWTHEGLLDVAHMPTMIERTGLRPATLNIRTVRSGAEQLAAAMRHAAADADVLICDAETDDDLHNIAYGSFQLGSETVWAGSAGLAYQLPHAANLVASAPPQQKPQYAAGPILFVIGSLSSVSHRQAVLLERESSIHAIRISPKVLLSGSAQPAWAEMAEHIKTSLQRGHDTLVVLDPAERVGLHERRLLTDALGVMLSPFATDVCALVATGGETARAIFDGWSISSLRIVGEVERGIPCSVAEIKGRTIPVLTKAGGFGDGQALLGCWHFLSKLLGDPELGTTRRTS